MEELRAERDAAQLSLAAALAAAKAKGEREGQGWLDKAEVARLREQRDQAIQLMQKEAGAPPRPPTSPFPVRWPHAPCRMPPVLRERSVGG